jgi:hypothetical protein
MLESLKNFATSFNFSSNFDLVSNAGAHVANQIHGYSLTQLFVIHKENKCYPASSSCLSFHYVCFFSHYRSVFDGVIGGNWDEDALNLDYLFDYQNTNDLFKLNTSLDFVLPLSTESVPKPQTGFIMILYQVSCSMFMK